MLLNLIFVPGVPESPYNLTVGYNQLSYGIIDVDVEWDAPFDGSSKITQYTAKIVDTVTQETRLFVTNLTRININASVNRIAYSRQYTVQVCAENIVGKSKFSSATTFKYELQGDSLSKGKKNNIKSLRLAKIQQFALINSTQSEKNVADVLFSLPFWHWCCYYHPETPIRS